MLISVLVATRGALYIRRIGVGALFCEACADDTVMQWTSNGVQSATAAPGGSGPSLCPSVLRKADAC